MADRHGVGSCRPEHQPKTSRLDDLTAAIKRQPDCAQLFLERGIVYLEKQEYYQAADDFSQAINLCPGLAQAYYKRSQVYYMLGKDHLAVQDRQQAKWLYTERWGPPATAK